MKKVTLPHVYVGLGLIAFLVTIIFLILGALASPELKKSTPSSSESGREDTKPGGFDLFSGSRPFAPGEGTTKTIPAGEPPDRSVPAGMLEYVSKKYRFSLFYPEYLNAQEYDEGSGAGSVTFESEDGKEGFQIFVVPYGADHVTQERFKIDTPSGVRKESAEVLIDGTPGTRFVSRHSLLGETQEVWFLKHGNLYEVVTYKAQGTWLGQIMQSWKFF